MRSTLRVSTAAALLLSARPAFPLSVQAEGGDVTVARSGVAGEVLRQLVHRASDDDDDDDSSAEQAYLDSVCSPESWDGDEVPPCIEISTIQSVCTPNGTSTLDLEAHAQCMCNGSFFADWMGCRECLYVHGGLSERNVTYWEEVINGASSILCDAATPTADFTDAFAQAVAVATVPTTGAETMVDQSSGDAAISLYYTASGAQGAGQITGSATAATAASTTAATTGSASNSKATTAHTTGTSGSAASTKSSTTSSSSNFAAPTGVPAAGKRWLLAVAGGALVAAAL